MTNVIMPSGNKKYDWIPEVDGDEQAKIGVDAFSDEDLRKLAQLSDITDVEIEEAGETPEEEDVVEVSIDEEAGDDLDGEEVEEEVEDLDDEVEEIEGESTVDQLIADVESLKESLDEIVEEAQEISGEVVDDVDDIEEDFVEDEDLDEEGFEEGGAIEEITEEEGLVAITPGEVEEEECETCQYCGSAKGISSVAGDSRKFTKLAAVSPENKKQIRTYWVDYLGYDPKYVDAMIQDYEK
jgi:hypothetical protein